MSSSWCKTYAATGCHYPSFSNQQQQQLANAVTSPISIDRRRLECAICMELYTDPRRLLCGHLYCSKCLFALREYAPVGVKRIVCPECKQSSEQPVEKLMVDYLVKAMVEEAKQQKSERQQTNNRVKALEIEIRKLRVQLAEKTPQKEHTTGWNEWELWTDSKLQVLDGRVVTHIAENGYAAIVHARPIAIVYDPQNPIRYFEVEIVQGGLHWIGLRIKRVNYELLNYGIYPARETIGAGDVIGMGIQLSANQHGKNRLFFTINGTLHDKFYSLPSIVDKWYPGVCLFHHGDKIEANFGQKNFKYDVSKYRHAAQWE